MFYRLKMVMFNSYLKLPEGTPGVYYGGSFFSGERDEDQNATGFDPEPRPPVVGSRGPFPTDRCGYLIWLVVSTYPSEK